MTLVRWMILAFVISTMSFTCSCKPAPPAQQPRQASKPQEVSKPEAVSKPEETSKPQEESYAFTFPESRLVLTIPKGGLVPSKSVKGGSTDNPRYFSFEDRNLGIMVSGWFEPEQRFLGTRKLWEGDTNEWRKNGLPAAQDEKFTKYEGWDTVIYDMALPPVTNSHVRAHWVQAGTWIDLHLSIVSDQTSAQARDKLLTLLQTFEVKMKE